MSQCKIFLENYSGVYYAGQEIRGRLECYFSEDTSIRGIKIRVSCKEHNSWSGTESYTDPSDHKTKTRHITLTGNNTVMFIEQMLFGSDAGTRTIGRGRHVYNFSHSLSHDIPSSFAGPYGSVLYTIKAIVDKPMSFDLEDEFIFTLQSPIDFNRMSKNLQDITTYSDEKTVCCWCCKGGNVTMDVELPKIAFIPGETIPFKVIITNLSNSNVENLKVEFKKTITYKVTSPHHQTKDDVDVILSFTEHGVGAHGEHTYPLSLAIPAYVDVPNFSKCDLFRVSYVLKVSAEMPSCVLDLDIDAWDVILGHIQCYNNPPGSIGDAPLYPPNEINQPVVYPPQTYFPPNNGAPYPTPNAPGAYPPLDKGIYPPGPPSAPSAPMATAPPQDNSKETEAMGGQPQYPPPQPQLPPPSYNQVQQQYP